MNEQVNVTFVPSNPSVVPEIIMLVGTAKRQKFDENYSFFINIP